MDRPEAARNENTLFRMEALSAARDNQLGSVLIHQPWGYALAAVIAAACIFLLLSFAYFGTYTRKATVSGLITPQHGMLRLTAAGGGVVSDVKVVEGQKVSKGQVLFVVSGERMSTFGGTQKLIAEQLEQRLQLMERNKHLATDRLNGQLRMFDSRLTTIAEELSRIQSEVGLLKKRVELANAHFQRQQKLVNAGFLSIAQMQQVEADMLALQGQQQNTQRAYASLSRERTELQAQRQEADQRHNTEMSEIEHSISKIRQDKAENDVLTQQVNVAPFSGTVTGVNAQIGQQVSAGELLASLMPQDAELTAHLYVPPRQAGFIDADQRVLMRYIAYPYQKFGMASGHVIEVAKTPYSINELPSHVNGAMQRPENLPGALYYRVTVKLDSQNISVYGKPHPLQAGLLLDADIIQDKRRLYEWAFEPLYSITGKLEH